MHPHTRLSHSLTTQSLSSSSSYSSSSSSSSVAPRFLSISRLSSNSISDHNLAQHEMVAKDRLASKSRSVYENANKRFFVWLKSLPDGAAAYFGENDKVKPESLDLPTFKTYILHLQNVKKLSYAALSTERSAFLSLLKENRIQMTSEAIVDLHSFFSGIHRRDASSRSRGDRFDGEGKMPLPFALFTHLAKKLIVSERRDHLWAHAYHAWLWASMARNNNIGSLLASHIRVDNDALCVKFEVTKCDQTAEKSPTIFIFANPLKPEICPVLALALHWMVFPCGIDGNRVTVFDCGTSATRFYEVLKSVCGEADSVAIMENHSLDKSGIGTHSYRKGSATYCSTGVSQPPPPASVHRRAGWTLGDASDKYVFQDPQGDRIVGRTLTGLAPHLPEFMTLPPHFQHDAPSSLILELLKKIYQPIIDMVLYVKGEDGALNPRSKYSEIRPVFFTLLRHLLASLIFHYQWLSETLPPRSLFRLLFSVITVSDVAQLSPFVTTDPAKGVMNVTGVSAVSYLFSDYSKLSKKMDLIDSKLDSLPVLVVSDMKASIEELMQATGNLTPNSVETILDRVLDRRIRELRGGDLQPSASPVTSSSSSSTSSTPSLDQVSNGVPLYCWGGKHSRVPENFAFPRCNFRSAWSYWWTGISDEETPICPFRYFDGKDLKDIDRGFLSEWKLVFSYLKAFLNGKGWKFTTIADTNNISAGITLAEPEIQKLISFGVSTHPNPLDISIATLARKIREKASRDKEEAEAQAREEEEARARAQEEEDRRQRPPQKRTRTRK